MDLSIILPVVNERDNIRQLLPRLKAVIERERLSFEIIVVDGGSSDGTPQTAAELGARAVPEQRRGYAGALATGIAEAQGDYVRPLRPSFGGRAPRLTLLSRRAMPVAAPPMPE